MNSLMTNIGSISIFDDMDITESTKCDYLARLPLFAGFLRRNGVCRNSLLDYKKYLRSRSDLGIASKNKYLAVARLSLRELYRRGAISIDLSLGVKSFQQSQKHRVEGLNEQEIEQLCSYLREQPDDFKNIRARALISLLLFQGLRQIEICRLDIDDVVLGSSRLSVLGKGRDDKEPIFLHPQTIRALRVYLRCSKVKHGALFTSILGQSTGRRLTTRGLRMIVKSLLSTAGIEKTVHGLRHSFVTNLVKAYKSDLLQVAGYTRHRSMEMLKVYNDQAQSLADLPRYYAVFSSFSLDSSPDSSSANS